MHPTSTFTARFVAAFAAAGLVTASIIFGATFAWTQYADYGPALAAAAVILAVSLEAAKPLAVAGMFDAFRQWQVGRAAGLALLATVAICYSLAAELQLTATARADRAATREAAAAQTSDARATRDRLRAELAALPAGRGSAEIEPQERAALAATRGADCDKWLANSDQRAKCLAWSQLRSELGRARDRERITAGLAAAEATVSRSGGTVAADPGAKALASFLAAAGIAADPTRLGDWLALVAVLALEAGSALAGLLLRPAPGSVVTAVSPPVPAVQPAATPPAQTPALSAVSAVSTPQLTARERLVAELRDNGGSVLGSQRALAARIGVSASRFNRVLAELSAEGLVNVRAGSTGTRLRLVN